MIEAYYRDSGGRICCLYFDEQDLDLARIFLADGNCFMDVVKLFRPSYSLHDAAILVKAAQEGVKSIVLTPQYHRG